MNFDLVTQRQLFVENTNKEHKQDINVYTEEETVENTDNEGSK